MLPSRSGDILRSQTGEWRVFQTNSQFQESHFLKLYSEQKVSLVQVVAYLQIQQLSSRMCSRPPVPAVPSLLSLRLVTTRSLSTKCSAAFARQLLTASVCCCPEQGVGLLGLFSDNSCLLQLTAAVRAARRGPKQSSCKQRAEGEWGSGFGRDIPHEKRPQ